MTGDSDSKEPQASQDLYELNKPGEVTTRPGISSKPTPDPKKQVKPKPYTAPAPTPPTPPQPPASKAVSEPDALGLPMTASSESPDLYEIGKPGEVTTRDGLDFDSDVLADSSELVELFHISPLNYLLLTGLVFVNVVMTGIDNYDMPLLKGMSPTTEYGFISMWLVIGASIQVAMSIGAAWACYNVFGRSMRASNVGLITTICLCMVFRYGLHTQNMVEKEARKAHIAAEAEAAAQKRKEEMEAQAAQAAQASALAPPVETKPIVETPAPAPEPAPAPPPAAAPVEVAQANPTTPTTRPRHRRNFGIPNKVLAGGATATPANPGSPSASGGQTAQASDDEDEFPELDMPDPTPNDGNEEAAIKKAKKNYMEQLKPLLGNYKMEAELFRDAGGLDFRTLTAPDLIDDRIKMLVEIRTAYEPYTKFVALTNINLQLQLEKAKVNEGKTYGVIDELLNLLNKYKYDPSRSKDLLVLSRTSTILIQVKHLAAGWKPSDDGRTLIDSTGKPLEQLNEYIANTRKIAGKTSIFKFLE